MKARWALAVLALLVGLFSPVATGATAEGASPPTMSVKPTTPLVDGQRLNVIGSGFPSSPFQLGLVECTSTTGLGTCAPAFRSVMVGGLGSFSTRYTASRLIEVQTLTGSKTVDCAQVSGCVLKAIDFENGLTAYAPLAFNLDSPFQVTIHVDPKAQVDSATGAVRIQGYLTCLTNLDVQLSGTLVQLNPPLTFKQPLFADPDHRLRLTCHHGSASWIAPVSSWPGKFAQGGAAGLFTPGSASLTISAFSANSKRLITQTTTAVQLQGSHTADPVYYLALGESLAHGYAARPGRGYTNDLLAHLQVRIPNLQLVELSCNDETTTQAINGDACLYGSAPGGSPLSQLKTAETFLSDHRGSVALITIDLGGVDLIRCSTLTCVTQAEATVAPNLTTIVAGLRQAGGNIPIVADNYFDPVLSDWFNGPSGQAYAAASVIGIRGFNSFLTSTYGYLGISVADIQAAFRTADTSPVASKWGVIPRDVYMMCRYTDIRCPQELLDADANARGYLIFNHAFQKIVDPLLFKD